MVKSMTGYGHYENVNSECKVTVEIKSVNHRYCDMNIKLPRRFLSIESKIRNVMKEYANRGKIDVFINYENYEQSNVRIQYHEDIAKEYYDAIVQAKEDFDLKEMGLNAASLVRYPEVVTLEENSQDISKVLPLVMEAVKKAGEEFLDARIAEGEHLKEDILQKLEYISKLLLAVEKRSPEMLKEYEKKIMDKVEELLGDRKIDETILATELTAYADKVCVDEETVRLHSHITNMQETLQKEEPIGRKLDFIAQEMNREANTILSKANDKELSENAINLKTEIEKIREQIQNIE